ncbi:hypothetical protein LAZ67_1008319 [Cordylochernes scorpioides]|uniref:Uncharacterized protein n=1 Tax=Cordylochernes scorpioides TaxID=51811 RepID=A0ABY6K0S5_9ARAC|nr:hypothetical protein LAZ67_1008319 [Cordylochernes scorpioides]
MNHFSDGLWIQGVYTIYPLCKITDEEAVCQMGVAIAYDRPKTQRTDISQQCLLLITLNLWDFWRRFGTVDEICIRHYSSNTSQSSGPGERAPKKTKSVVSAGKVMTTVFWDTQGIIIIGYLKMEKQTTGDIKDFPLPYVLSTSGDKPPIFKQSRPGIESRISEGKKMLKWPPSSCRSPTPPIHTQCRYTRDSPNMRKKMKTLMRMKGMFRRTQAAKETATDHRAATHPARASHGLPRLGGSRELTHMEDTAIRSTAGNRYCTTDRMFLLNSPEIVLAAKTCTDTRSPLKPRTMWINSSSH